MGIVRMGPPIEIILELKEAYRIKNFIETGTYSGDTAYWASQVFEQVLTIEYSQFIYEKAAQKYTHINNIEFLYGDTRQQLSNIIQDLNTPSLFWLDAHWSGGLTYGETDQCPLIEEIEIINNSDHEHFIFIDDARLFMSPPPLPLAMEQWPEITTVLKALNSSKNSRYLVIIEDVIIAVPGFAKSRVACSCQKLNNQLWQEQGQKIIKSLPLDKSLSTKEKANKEKSVITISTLGKRGRFGNQLFQYAFLKIYAKKHDLRVETTEWIGRYLFGHNDPLISRQLPIVFTKEGFQCSSDCLLAKKEVFKDVDFLGYFTYHTKYYVDYKNYFHSLFQPVPEVKARMEATVNRLRSQGKTLVGLHLRRGDFGRKHLFVAPSQWYKEWLRGFWETLDEPILFIASDEPEKVLDDFAEYRPITVKELGVEIPEAEFYPDFYILSQCDAVAISNSTFSFTACMLNERGKFFFRPHLETQKLIPFEPWNSEPILNTIRNIYLIIFPDWSQPEEHLFGELEEVIRSVVTHPQKRQLILFIDASNTSLENANLILSSVTMELFLQEELDITDEPEIFLIGEFNEVQWKYVLFILDARLVLANENKQAITELRAESLPSYTLDNFKEEQIFRSRN
jgi:hypothetical protein